MEALGSRLREIIPEAGLARPWTMGARTVRALRRSGRAEAAAGRDRRPTPGRSASAAPEKALGYLRVQSAVRAAVFARGTAGLADVLAHLTELALLSGDDVVGKRLELGVLAL